jgi:hypothetical protein
MIKIKMIIDRIKANDLLKHLRAHQITTPGDPHSSSALSLLHLGLARELTHRHPRTRATHTPRFSGVNFEPFIHSIHVIVSSSFAIISNTIAKLTEKR